jgi:hypothetical protein
MRTVVIPAKDEGFEATQLRAVVAQLNAAIEEVKELRELLAAYAVDEYGSFPAEIDRYFQRHPETVQEVANG